MIFLIICKLFVLRFLVVLIIELFIFCNFGKIIKMMIGMLKVIWESNIF